MEDRMVHQKERRAKRGAALQRQKSGQKDYICIMSNKEQIIKKIIGVVDKNAPDSEVYLYGSQARGNSKEMSDWDLLILLNRQNIPFDFETKFMDEFYELELETGEIISPLIYSKLDWNQNHIVTPLFENIQREGVKIK